MKNLTIRQIVASDIPHASGLVQENYDVESAAMAAREMYSALKGATPKPIYFVAYEHPAIVGLIGISASFMNHRIFEVFWVNVKPSHQGRGIGKMLVATALKYAHHQAAESVMLTATDSLTRFYAQLGFAARGKIGNDNYDDNLMEAKPPYRCEQ